MGFENIVKNIDSLPPLSNAAHIIQTLYAGGLENLNISRLVKVIESDAMLAANILKMINAPYYSFSNKIGSISQAVTLCGSSKIYMSVIQYAMNEKLKADPSIYGFNTNQFNDLCHLQSALMQKWYSTINIKDAKFLTPLALIMESGKLVLATEVINSDYVGEFRKGYNECENIQEYEISIINHTSYYLTALLFEHWNLEPDYVYILKNLDSQDTDYIEEDITKKRTYEKELNVIRTAINAKDILSDAGIEKASYIVENMGYSAEEFIIIAKELRDSYIDGTSRN
ncbi:HDOD domain-containing protein [Sulfurimonas sp.]|nr:HDOD domain-containing protein [Sulfurimonas sp.]